MSKIKMLKKKKNQDVFRYAKKIRILPPSIGKLLEDIPQQNKQNRNLALTIMQLNLGLTDEGVPRFSP